MSFEPNREVEQLLARVDDAELREALRRAWERRVPPKERVRKMPVSVPPAPDLLLVRAGFESDRHVGMSGCRWDFRVMTQAYNGATAHTVSTLDPFLLRWVMTNAESDNARAWLSMQSIMERTLFEGIGRALRQTTLRIRYNRNGFDLLWHGDEEPGRIPGVGEPIEQAPALLVGASRGVL